MDDPTLPQAIARAAEAVRRADALLITAGAGMGVDSGLPAFRGPEGFAAAYPALARRGLRYEYLASPAAFADDPHLAWGFHGMCLARYRAAEPHAGFQILRRWAAAKPAGWFVYTSNIDGLFQKAGFDPARVAECHGSILRLQCGEPCCDQTWPAADGAVRVDEATGRAANPLPACPRCGRLARPNVRMFEDAQWVGRPTRDQVARFERWKAGLVGRSVVVVEGGAGPAVPAVRLAADWVMLQLRAVLVRINPREADVPPGHVAVPLTAARGIAVIDELLTQHPAW